MLMMMMIMRTSSLRSNTPPICHFIKRLIGMFPGFNLAELFGNGSLS